MNLPFRLLLITDRSLMGTDPVGRVIELARPKVPGWALQWRDPEATPADLYRDLLAVRDRLAGTSGTGHGDRPRWHADARVQEELRIFVNDRVDVAAALGLDAHLKETSLPTRAARALLPPPALLGRSVHAVSSAAIAADEGADYLLFGPIFDTPSKRAFGTPQGLDALRRVAAAVPVPVVAVGGIDARLAGECIAAGAAGIAVIRAVWDHPHPLEAMREILGSLPS
jgi:thiamine-phosphate pyrophosphorylase